MNLQLKRLRKERGYSQKEIAEACEVDQTTVSQWEVGKVRLPLEDAVTIADLFACSLDELAGPQTDIYTKFEVKVPYRQKKTPRKV